MRLGGLGLDADASVENTAKAVAVTTRAIAHAGAVAGSSVPAHGDERVQYLIFMSSCS